MILHPYTITLVLASSTAITTQCAGAFIPLSRKIYKCYCTHNRSSFRIAGSVQRPPLTHSPSSDEDSSEEEVDHISEGPYDYLFHSRKRHEQARTTKFGQHKEHVHIILFNQGLQTESIHTIEFPKCSGSNIILAFESFKDCQHFANNLATQMNLLPMPQEIPRNNLETYAASLGMTVQAIPEGMNLRPPDQNCDARASEGGLGGQVTILMELKEQRANLDRLIGASASPPLIGSVGHVDRLPAWG